VRWISGRDLPPAWHSLVVTTASLAGPDAQSVPVLNSRGLPALDSDVLDALFHGSTSGGTDNEITSSFLAGQHPRSREWFEILYAHQAFNLAHRQPHFRRLGRVLEPSLGEPSVAIPEPWLALALALKEAYGMSDSTLARVMLELRLRPLDQVNS
jgi:hypothetical protein